ncbi:MAG: ATP-binding cassette domain-containing protein, partial [Pseudomonadota bacterium]
MSGALAVEELTVIFGDGEMEITAVDDVSFSVTPGEAFGLIGESGSGKSTVLRAIAGLNDRYGGSVRVDGAEAPRPRTKAFFKRVQMVFQDPYGSLHPRRLVRSTLLEPLAVHGLDAREERIA